MEAEDRISGTGSGASTAGNVVDRANVRSGDRSAVNAEVRASIKVEARATVNVEDRATVKLEARATVTAGDRSVANAIAEDRWAVNVDDCSAVNAEARAAVNAKERATVNPEARATVKAEDGATVNAVDRVTVNVEARTTVKAEDRAAVNAETRATVNSEAWVAVKAEDRATVKAEGRANANAEARATVTDEYCATANVEARATAKAEGRFDAETRAAINEERSDTGALQLTRSRALFLELDCTRSERRNEARALARMNPEEKAFEIAVRNLVRLARVRRIEEGRVEEVKKILSEEVWAINEELKVCRASLGNSVCASDGGVAVARRRKKLLASREEAHVLARMGPQAMMREFRRGNRAKWIAVSVIHRHPRCAGDELKTVEMDLEAAMDDVTIFGLPGGRFSAEAIQEELRSRRELARTLAGMDPHERAWKIARRNRAKRIAARALNRHHRQAADELKEAEIDLNADTDGVDTRTSDGLVSPAAIEEGPGSTGELTCALAEMDPEEWAMEAIKKNRAIKVAQKNRANQMALRLFRWQSNRLAEDMKNVRMDLKAALAGEAARTSGGVLSVEAFRKELRASRELAAALAEMDPQARVEELAKRRRARCAVAYAIQRHRRRDVDAIQRHRTREFAAMSASFAAFFEQERNRRRGATAEARASGKKSEAKQEELGATKEKPLARALAETDHPREIKREAPWRNGEMRVKIRVDRVKEMRAPADETSTPSATKRKLQTGGQALVDGTGASEVELETGRIALVDGTGTGQVDGKETVVDGSMDGSGSCEFPFVEAKQEELRAKAMVEVAERVALDAVEVKKKADLTRTRRSEKDRRRAENQERRTSRDARRAKKLQVRESRAKRTGERSRPAVEVKKETVAEEGRGMLAQGARAEELSRL